jgi:hypothetical protein
MMVSPDAKPVKESEGDWPIEGKDNVLAGTSLLNYGGTLGVHGEEKSRKGVFSASGPARIPPELIKHLVADGQRNSADLKRYV